MGVLDQTKMIWGWFIAITALFVAVSQTGLIPINIQAGVINAAILALLGVTILAENKFQMDDPADAILTLIGVTAFVFATITLFTIQVPPAFASLAVFLYALLAGATIWSIYK